MPVAQGLMQAEVLDVRFTTSTITNITPSSPAACGATYTATVKVVAETPPTLSDKRPTGTVQIIRTEDSSVVGSGTLVNDTPTNQSTVDIVLTLTNATNTLKARYAGATNNFAPSISATGTSYTVDFIITAVTFTVPTPSGTPNEVCFNNSIPLTARVQRVPPSPEVTTGVIAFRLYSDESNFTVLSSGVAVNGTGHASYTIPAATLTAGNTYGVQGVYIPSDPCISASNSAAGITGSTTKFHARSLDAVYVTVSVTGSPECCVIDGGSKTFPVTVVPTDLPPPSVGTVYLVNYNNNQVMGSATPVNGAANIVVPNSSWPGENTFTITGAYTGDGNCYGNIDHFGNVGYSSFTFSPHLNTVTCGLVSVSPSSFSASSGGDVTITASYSGSPVNNVNGQTGAIWAIYQMGGTPQYFFGTGTIAMGTLVKSLPKSTFTPGTYYIQVQFYADYSTAGCSAGDAVNFNNAMTVTM